MEEINAEILNSYKDILMTTGNAKDKLTDYLEQTHVGGPLYSRTDKLDLLLKYLISSHVNFLKIKRFSFEYTEFYNEYVKNMILISRLMTYLSTNDQLKKLPKKAQFVKKLQDYELVISVISDLEQGLVKKYHTASHIQEIPIMGGGIN